MVDPSTGEPWIEVTDLAIQGTPEDLVLARTWDSDRWAWSGESTLIIEAQSTRHTSPTTELPAFPPIHINPTEEPGCPPGSELDNDHGDLLLCTEEGFELTHSDGSVEHYDAAGQLLVRDPGAEGELRFGWGQDGLESLSRPDGRRIEISEARVVGSRRERRASEPGGQQVRYEYDDEDRLVTVTTPGGMRHRYIYDDQGRLEALLWSDGSRAVLRRDSQGRVQRIEGPGLARWRFEWGERGLERAWDGSGAPWSLRQRDDEVTLADPAGRSASVLMADGRVAGWKDPAGYSTFLERDGQGRPTGLRAPNGARWSIEIDTAGRLTRLVDPQGSPWRIDYDTRNRRVTISDPAGRVRRYSTDDEGRIIEIDDGAVRTGLRRDSAGRVREIVHGTQGSTRIERDGSGRPTAVIDAGGAETRLSDWTGTVPGTIKGPDGGTWKVMFDRLSQVRAISSPGGTLTDWNRAPGGGIASVQQGAARTRLDRRTDGAITRMVDPLGRLSGWTRDAVGRITAWLLPDGSQLRITRDARGDPRSLELGEHRLELERDMLGRPTALKRADDEQSELLTWARNLAGTIQEVAWPHGSLELERDSAGLVRRVVLGDRSWTLSRDPAGRLRSVQEGERRWTIRRDDAGLATGLETPDSTLSIELDPRGLAQRAEVFGARILYRRDAAGRPARIEGPGGAALGVQRDSAGRPVLLRFPGGPLLRISTGSSERSLRLEDASGRVVYEARGQYDEAGRLTSISDSSGTRHHRYGPFDQLLSVETDTSAWSVFPGRHEGPPGTLVVNTDERGRPTQAEISLAAPAWGVARQALEYDLDAAGDVRGILGDSGHATLEHDPLGRLVAVTISDGSDGAPLASWRVAWDPFGRPEAIQTDDDRVRLAFHDGRLLGVEERGRAAALLGDEEVAVLAGEQGYTSLITGIGGYRELSLFPEGEPYVAASTPGGLRDLGHPGLLADLGRLQLFPGGPLLGPMDARDPLSGLPTSAQGTIFPWQVQGWPDPEERTRWPELDGATPTLWDPAPWDQAGPWGDPLAVLVALGEIEPTLGDEWWQVKPAAAPLPWMPASLEGRCPAPLPPLGALPMEEGPVAALFLSAAQPPADPVQDGELSRALLAAELPDMPAGWPGLEPPANIRLDDE